MQVISRSRNECLPISYEWVYDE